MKIIIVAAISKDGFLTNGDNPDVSSWTSAADKAFFKDIKSKHQLFVMGSKTFDSGAVIPKPGNLKIILTTNIEKYKTQEIQGQLEFKNITPQEFVSNYEPNFEACLLLGGGFTYSNFLKENLVDEIYLTVEPVKLESGTPLLTNGKLIAYTDGYEPEVTQLNDYGTLLMHYVLNR